MIFPNGEVWEVDKSVLSSLFGLAKKVRAMQLFEGYELDWTAIAALIALGIWVVDGMRRSRERAASRRLLAQIMTTPVGIAQIDIARFRSLVAPPNGDTANILSLIDSRAFRETFASKALEVKLELPAQFLEKSDLFGEKTANCLALALSEIGRLHIVWKLAAEVSDGLDGGEAEDHVHLALEQIQKAESAIGEAFNALLVDGRASIRGLAR